MSATTAEAPKTSNGTAVAKPAAKPTSIRQWLQSDAMKHEFAQALPKHLTPERFVRVALTALTRTPKLAECDQASFFQALLSLSQYGLEPDGRRAHLIPFENRKRGVCEVQLIIDYKGLAELVMRSGLVSNLHADIVCENDDFEYDKGFITRHRVDFRADRGKPYAVYCVCRFRDGTEKCDVMTLAEVEKIRSRSKAGQSGPWVTDFNEMAKKSVFRRLSKWLPLSAEIRAAAENDDDTIDEAGEAPARRMTLDATATRSEQLASMLGARQPTDAESLNQTRGEESQATADAEPSTQVAPETDTQSEIPSDPDALDGLGTALMEAETATEVTKVKAAFSSPTLSESQRTALGDAVSKRLAELAAKKSK